MEIELMEPENIQANMYITVVDWKSKRENPSTPMAGSLFASSIRGMGVGVPQKRKDFVGVTLRVLAVDLPFVKVWCVDNHADLDPDNRHYQLDVREVDIKELSREFVAVKPFLENKYRLTNLSKVFENMRSSAQLIKTLENRIEAGQDKSQASAARHLVEDAMKLMTEEATRTT